MNYAHFLIFNLLQANNNTKCTLNLIKTFNRSSILYVFDNNDVLDTKALYNLQGSFSNINIRKDFQINIRNYDLMIVNVQDLKCLNDFLGRIYRTLFWEKSAQFVFVNLESTVVEEAMRIAWNYYIIKLIIVTSDFGVYSYKPISEGGCALSKPIFVGSCENFTGFLFDYGLLHFEGCELRVGSVKLPPYVINEYASDNPGYEVVMMREIQEHLRFVYVYVKHNHTNHGERTNGSVSGLYGMLIRKELDVVVGAPKAEGYLVEIFDGSKCYTSMSMAVFVRSANLQNPSSRFFKIFSFHLWLLIGLTTLFVIISMLFYEWLYGRQRGFFTKLILLLNIAFNSYSTNPQHAFNKTIFIIWCIASFFVTTLFTNTFMTFLAIPCFEKQLDTLDDIAQAGLKIGGYIVTRSIAQDQNSTFDNIYEEWVNCSLQGDECIRDTLDGKMGIVKNTRSIYFHLGIYNKKTIHLTTILTNNLLWLVMDKGLPVAERTDDLIQWMLHSGLMNKWESDSMDVKRDKPDEQKITLYVTSAFILLGCGLLSASVQFLFEIVYYSKSKRSVFAEETSDFLLN